MKQDSGSGKTNDTRSFGWRKCSEVYPLLYDNNLLAQTRNS